jgi:HEAT repeat protein
LRDEDKEVRWSAAEDLGFAGGRNKKAERIIRAALKNVEDNIQKEATHALEILEEQKELETMYAESRKVGKP